jgi:hypothetical protein
VDDDDEKEEEEQEEEEQEQEEEEEEQEEEEEEEVVEDRMFWYDSCSYTFRTPRTSLLITLLGLCLNLASTESRLKTITTLPPKAQHRG